MFDFAKGILIVNSSYGKKFEFHLRGKVTIVNGLSATGKTYLCEYIKEVQQDLNSDFGTEFDNVFLLNSENKDCIYKQLKKLIIVDRAELILSNDIVNFINSDNNNKYLIFSRGLTGIRVTPNYFATIERDEDKYVLRYEFSEKGWF